MATLWRTVLRASPATKPASPERAAFDSPSSSIGALTGLEVMLTMRPNLRAAGFKEEEILEAIQVVAIYNSDNRINNALGMQPNDEARPGFQRT